jgi:hypothetical protein
MESGFEEEHTGLWQVRQSGRLLEGLHRLGKQRRGPPALTLALADQGHDGLGGEHGSYRSASRVSL